MRLEGKVALISGGGRGQGAVEARLFAREGAKVVFGDVLDDAGKQVEAEIHEAGAEATYVHLDVTREDDWTTWSWRRSATTRNCGGSGLEPPASSSRTKRASHCATPRRKSENDTVI